MRKALMTQPRRALSMPNSLLICMPAMETLVRSRNAIALKTNSHIASKYRMGKTACSCRASVFILSSFPLTIYLLRARLFGEPATRTLLPVSDRAIGPIIVLGAGCYRFGNFGDLSELLQIDFDS